MTEQEQRIAIAEFCGWKDCFLSPGIGVTGNRPSPMDVYARGLIPDFLHDLNAMHEAAMQLRTQHPLDYIHYAAELTSIVAKANSDWQPTMCISTHDATAAQRAEALLKTVGKWKD